MAEFTEDRKEYQKIWRENHKEKMRKYMKEYMREYNKINKEKYQQQNDKRKTIRIDCECGCNIGKYNLEHHSKTKKHKTLLEKNLI